MTAPAGPNPYSEPHTRHVRRAPIRGRRSGFTLLELMVVIAIITIVAWIGFSLIGVLRGGDPLESAVAAIKGTVTRSRAQALATQSRLNLLVDFENNVLTPLERRTVVNFSFESDMGSFGRFIVLGPNAYWLGRDSTDPPDTPMLNGGSLDLDGGTARIPMMGDLAPERGADGVAVGFSVYPYFTGNFTGVLVAPESGAWSLEVESADGGGAWLVAKADGATAEAKVPMPAFQWSDIELYVSPILLQLQVNGVPSTAILGQRSLSFPSGLGVDVLLGSTGMPRCQFDDLRIDVVTKGEPVPLSRAVLLPPGASADVAITPGQAWQPQPGAITVAADELSDAPLPLTSAETWDPTLPPPRRALIGFDSKGALDQSMHQGRVILDLIHRGPDGNIQQMTVEISPAGLVSSRRVPVRVVFDPLAPPLESLDPPVTPAPNS
jgi:prepilin-type N-terminal cleavage/methylation domain-containing protein